MTSDPKRVVFLHPDLGIGGAERLVIDAAIALKSAGHRVSFLTSHSDPSHRFADIESHNLQVQVIGDWLPRSLCGRLQVVFAYVRMIYAAMYLVFFSKIRPDVVFCDQISACIPVLRLFSSAKIMFYCHFPDLLLSKHNSFLKRIYRAPIDWVEEKTTGMAHVLLVNSNFTASVFKKTFKSLSGVKLTCVYPPSSFADEDTANGFAPLPAELLPAPKKYVFLSLNRYEKKKQVDLAVEALAVLRSRFDASVFKEIHLVIAGGYDERVDENVKTYVQLCGLVKKLRLQDSVTFIRSCSAELKSTLLKNVYAVIYTPPNEHFGIVPIEAMYNERPVIACSSGGPLETILNGETGLLLKCDPEEFANGMQRLIENEFKTNEMGQNGRVWVKKQFSFQQFSSKLNKILSDLVQ